MADLDDVPTQGEYATWRKATMQNPEHPDYPDSPPIWNPGQLTAAVGTTVGGRTWRQINEDMRIYLETAPPLLP
jgi:hypothetical protein